MTELTPNFWLPSNVLSDDEDNDAHWEGDTEATQETAGLINSSSSCSRREKGSDHAWDLLDGAAFLLKVNEVNWTKDFQGDWSSANNIDVNDAKGSAFTTWNSANQTENSSIVAKQFMREKPCHVPSGWRQQSKPMHGHFSMIADHSYPPWASVHGSGSGMKAVFLESNRSGRESGGTGVFLPRRVGNICDSKKKKKPGCSTVLLPYRVVQALNLTFQNMNSRPFVCDLGKLKQGGSIDGRKIDDNKPLLEECWSRKQKKDFYQVNSNTQALPPEISLPQDWTY